MGMIGLNFNDAFGYAFARAGVSCVQVHTPNRHLAHTRIQDILCFLMLPLLFIPGIGFLICFFRRTVASHIFIGIVGLRWHGAGSS